jgi:hypothetical protein
MCFGGHTVDGDRDKSLLWKCDLKDCSKIEKLLRFKEEQLF